MFGNFIAKNVHVMFSDFISINRHDTQLEFFCNIMLSV